MYELMVHIGKKRMTKTQIQASFIEATKEEGDLHEGKGRTRKGCLY